MTSPRSLADWLALLESRHPLAIELGLDRVAAVAGRLGLDRPAPRVVTVAGTNGKGSCVALLEALLLRAGVRVGAYTSPHLLAYNERVRIAGQPASDAALCAAFARIEAARGDIRLTYFEVGTLAALLLFAAAGCEVAVLEVGLGGRLDAVNIVAPDVAVITAIDLDHQAWLGDDRDRIGVEKAGIARPGVPTVCGDPAPPAAMLAALARIGSPVLALGGGQFRLYRTATGLALDCTARDGTARHYAALPAPRLPAASAACAVQALVTLGLPPTADAVAAAFAETGLPGRFQQVDWGGCRLILDVAHNPAAAALLAQRLSAECGSERPVAAVVGALADKDLPGLVAPLLPLVGHWYCCDLPGVARAAPAARLAEVLYNGGGGASCHADPVAGLAAARRAARDGGPILVFGSFHTVAPILALLADDAEADGGDVR
jgi:dihydrofolate synthase/folylpolyglutamate synthase